MPQRFNVLIPAAGFSSRMGSSKLWLKTAEGKTFVEYLVFEYAKLNPSAIVLVVNTQGFSELESIKEISKKCKIVINANPEFGRMHSIRIGLDAFSETLPLFIHNIDNPFVIQLLLVKMIDKLSENEIVIPTYEGKGGHPILLSGKAVSLLKESTLHIDFKEFVKNFTPYFFSSNYKSILLNINTPKDYNRYLGGKF